MNNKTFTDWVQSDITIAFNIAIGSSALLLNAILLLVLYRDPFKKFRTPGTILVTNLSIADGLTGLFTVLRMVFSLHGFHQPKGVMIVFSYSTFLTIQCSLFTVLFIAWERVFAVSYPIRFKLYVTKKRTFMLSVTAWAFSLILTNLPEIIFPENVSNRLTFLIFGCFNFLIILLIIAGYYAVYKVLKQKESDMGRYGAPGDTPPGVLTGSLKRKRNHLTENKRFMKTFYVITAILLITVLPMIILTSTAAICPRKCAWRALWIYFRVEPVLLLNFLVNPLVYAFQLPAYRQAFLTLFRCRKQLHEVEPANIELNSRP